MTVETVERLGGVGSLTAAPMVPSLQQEADLGFDLALAGSWALIFLQFKIATRLVRRSAGEAKVFGVPYFRFPVKTDVTANGRCQHNVLCELEKALVGASDFVLYVAPMFDSPADLGRHTLNRDLTAHSVFVAPSVMGPVTPGDPHHFGYRTGHDITPFSEPGDSVSGTFESVVAALLNSYGESRSLVSLLQSTDEVMAAMLEDQLDVPDSSAGVVTAVGAAALGLQPILIRHDAVDADANVGPD